MTATFLSVEETPVTGAARIELVCSRARIHSRRGRGRLFDPAAAEHQIAGVEDRSLPGSHGPLGFIEHYFDAGWIARPDQACGGGGVAIADLHLGAHGRAGLDA